MYDNALRETEMPTKTKPKEFIKRKKDVYITVVNKKRTPYFKDPQNRFYLFHADSLEFLDLLQPNSIDMIFADPPYNLSNDGIRSGTHFGIR